MNSPCEIWKRQKRLFPQGDTSASSVLIYDGGSTDSNHDQLAGIWKWCFVNEMRGTYLFFHLVNEGIHIDVVLSCFDLEPLFFGQVLVSTPNVFHGVSYLSTLSEIQVGYPKSLLRETNELAMAVETKVTDCPPASGPDDGLMEVAVEPA